MLSVFVGVLQVWTTPRPLVLTTLRRSRRRVVGRGRAVGAIASAGRVRAQRLCERVGMPSVFVGVLQVWTTPRPLVLTTLRRSRRRAVGRGRAVGANAS